MQKVAVNIKQFLCYSVGLQLHCIQPTALFRYALGKTGMDHD